MSLSVGARLGSYEILASLGAGGMGEVYRARDTKLNRDVAIKILPDAFASDADRVARFTREAQTLATLNHPHIAQIHGLEESSGVRALVMELVEGEDLAQRIARGAIPIDEALAIGKQIAEALAAAHEQGIIHRDLKPANIKLRPDGTVKVLDFGLAKVFEATSSGAPSSVSMSPTLTAGTQMGVILGTAAYMAPEQARGKPVDQRADIWAFGCVLYEMLTGRAAFSGETVTDVLSAVVRSEPDWRALPPAVGPHPTRLMKRCLAKDPVRRLRHAGDALLDLEESADGVTPSTRPSSLLPYRIALAVALVTIAILAIRWVVPATEAPPRVVRFQIETAPQLAGVAVSPDGRAVAYVAADEQGTAVVWVQSLEAGSVHKIDGTQGATGSVFWSPDSRSLAFGATGGLKIIDVTGGAARLIAPNLYGPGSWSRDGTVVFSGSGRGLVAVAAAGGSMRDLVRLDAQSGERALVMPFFLPDGRLLYTRVLAASREICVTSKAGSPASCFGLDGAVTGIVHGSYLLFARGSTLLAQRFDSRSVRIEGEPVIVAQDAALNGFNLSSSDTGVLAYASGVSGRIEELVWFDRRGTRLQTTGTQSSFSGLDLSPDARQRDRSR